MQVSPPAPNKMERFGETRVILRMKRRSIMKSISDEQFSETVKTSQSYSEVCRKLGLRLQGSNYNTLKRRIAKVGADASHFQGRIISAQMRTRPLAEVLVADSDYGGDALKKRLFRTGLLKYQCKICDCTGSWRGEELVLQLDHMNGNHRDNRIENLRILCPNCHSQTKTFGGRRFRKIYICPACDKEYPGTGRICLKCDSSKTHLKLPSNEEIERDIWMQPCNKLAELYKCSQSGLRAHCYRAKIQIPSYGYWQRRKAGMSHEEALNYKKPEPKFVRHLNEEEIKISLEMLKSGFSARKVARRFLVAHTTINLLRNKNLVVNSNSIDTSLSRKT